MKYIILLAILLVACQPTVICNAPYIHSGTECCIDLNEDLACDENIPEKIVEKTEGEDMIKEVKIYVCPSGAEVTDPKLCTVDTEEEIEVPSSKVTAEFDLIKDRIKNKDQAVFVLALSSELSETDTFEISSLDENWIVKTYPLRNPVTLAVAAGSTSRLTINIEATHLMEDQEYFIDLLIKGLESKEELTTTIKITVI